MTLLQSSAKNQIPEISANFWKPRQTLTLEAARRHSVFVHVARYTLLACATLLIATLGWFFVTAPKLEAAPTSIDETVKMINPIYKGRTIDGLPYKIIADEAVRFIANPDALELNKPVLSFSRIETVDDSLIIADKGSYNSRDHVLDLYENVQLDTDDGYKCQTIHSRIFVKGKRITGVQKIDCQGAFGRIGGNAYEINKGYTEYVFKNGVTAYLLPKQTQTSLGEALNTEASTSPPSVDIRFDTDDPVDVIASKAVHTGQMIVLTGNVDVQQKDVRITADRMDLFREKISESDDGRIKYGNVNIIDAQGHFKYTNSENTLVGDNGVYERDKAIITVIGNVVYSQKSGESVTGCKLVYDLTLNRAKFGGPCKDEQKQNGRVVIKTGP